MEYLIKFLTANEQSCLHHRKAAKGADRLFWQLTVNYQLPTASLINLAYKILCQLAVRIAKHYLCDVIVGHKGCLCKYVAISLLPLNCRWL